MRKSKRNVLRRSMIGVLVAMLLLTGPAFAGSHYEAALRYQVNHQARVGMPTLKYGPCVDRFAERRARYLARTGRFEHLPLDRPLNRCNGVRVGEVLLRGTASAEHAAQLWLDSPDHNAVLTRPSYERLGHGVARMPDGRLVVSLVLIEH